MSERTEKTDKQANKLVAKRTKVRARKEKVASKKKKTKVGKFLQKTRLKRLSKKEEKIQSKINKNPTAQSWRKKGQAKSTGLAKGMYKKGGFKQDSFLEAPIPRLFED